MNWLFKLLDSGGTNQASVDANGSVKVTGPTTLSQSGFIALAGRNDDGVTLGTPTVRRIKATIGGRAQVGQSTLLWEDNFNANTQNTSKYRAPVTTQTVIYSNAGYVTLNGSSITTINTNSAFQTYRTFPFPGTGELRVEIHMRRNIDPQANAVTEMGLFSATLPGGAVPTDGVFFRWNAAGELRGVMNFNGTDTQTAAITSPSINVNHKYVIVIDEGIVEWFIDDVKVASQTVLTDTPANGQCMFMDAQPFTFRHYIGGSAPASGADNPRISQVNIWTTDPNSNRDWQTQKTGMGLMGYQGQNGNTMGSTANYANNANPTATVPTNTTAALGSGLGGQFWETTTLAANTDGIIQSFQNPVGSTTVTPRNLVIRGITYHCYNQVALATVAFNKQQSLAYGHTAVSLATAETATTKAPRRIALGVLQPVAAVNTAYPQYTATFSSPIVIAPGEFVALVSKNVGTVPATGVIAWMVTYDAYFE